MTVKVIGIRHHSPACARLVAHVIATEKPVAVLIEGPSDFNQRLDELLLDHRLPLALYSYANEGLSPAQCWFPFLEYSPEWVALQQGRAAGAILRFIDLPHWQYRTEPDARQHTNVASQRSRYAEGIARLCLRFGCEGDHALWDHLFEAASLTELPERLDVYFEELRGDEEGGAEDAARELCMAQWIAWAHRQFAGDGPILVVCGGWHKPALERLWPTLEVMSEPALSLPLDARQAGSYLVPFEYRQVDALGGYWAGMQSPLYYQWVWEHGLPTASKRAVEMIVARLRNKQVALSTADLLALEYTLAALSRLRGHAAPLRTDILDALQSAVIKEALEVPPPWVTRGLLGSAHHPALREALLALTGEGGGQLHPDTPLPPLLHDVTARLKACNLVVQRAPQTFVLDRRRADDSRTAQALWQLHLLAVQGVRLTAMRAPHAARSLHAELLFEEHWSLIADDRWFPDLIEAAAYGATLEMAARNRLLEQVHAAQGNAVKIAQCMLQAIRAALPDIGLELAERLEQEIPQVHDHAALAEAAHSLLQVAQAGFWGQDTRPLLENILLLMAQRLLWLLENRQGAQVEHIQGDVNAVRVFDVMFKAGITGFEATAILETLRRFAGATIMPPALRGAALGVCYVHHGIDESRGQSAHTQLLNVIRSVPPRTALGDFLYGLFSCARATATESNEIVDAVHAALESMSTEDFLVALPQMRAAFTWFPPRERGALASHVAGLLGLSGAERHQLLSLRQGGDTLLDAKRIETQALAWATELGVLGVKP